MAGTLQPQTSNLERAGEDEPTRVYSKLVRLKPRADEKASRGAGRQEPGGTTGPRWTNADNDLDLAQTLGCLLGLGPEAKSHQAPSRVSPFGAPQMFDPIAGGMTDKIMGPIRIVCVKATRVFRDAP